VELFLRLVWEFFFGNPLPAGFTGRNRGSAGWRVAQAIVLLFIFNYWNFFARLVWFRAGATQLGARVLPLGVSFLTCEFIRYATDRCKSKTEAGNVGE
jgi:D-alanyl-lipoteichoic acid acyltransferase DltB (MBOAT superfamily)